ncbi:MAG: LysR family transcriptional regulator [Hyphomicrobiaceae bacterium]
MSDLPPLKAVRAFEACYRLGSFGRAARSLNVGQPAISHQIRLLETDLGTRLFQKRGSQTLPTAAAHQLYAAIAPALDTIGRASQAIRRRVRSRAVTVATYPGIAAYWLLPRLARLSEAGDRLAVRVTTAERDADMPLDEVDCAILFGHGDWGGRRSIALMAESVVPVASPALARRLKSWPPARLLAEAPLIHLEDPERRWFDWSDWRDRFAPEIAEVPRTTTGSPTTARTSTVP